MQAGRCCFLSGSVCQPDRSKVWNWVNICFILAGMNTEKKSPLGRRRAECRIREAEAGLRLLDFLTSRFSYHPRIEWAGLVDRGNVLLNGEMAGPDELLKHGDRVEYLIPERAEPEVDDTYRVLDEDDAILVIDKPGNLPTHPAGKFFSNTLWGLLKKDRPGCQLHFVNRLDRETSGVIMLAKSPSLCARMAENMKAADCQKIYLAAVEGRFPDSVDADGFLTGSSTSVVRKKVAFSITPASSLNTSTEVSAAHTVFRCRQSLPPLSLVEARLLTGKTHQIRATLEYLGFPLVGDKLYGVDESIFVRFISNCMTNGDRKHLRLPRQALHAARMTVRHPVTGRLQTWTAPLPQDMTELLAGRTGV